MCEQIIVKVPYTTNNARQILDKDYLMYNVCQGSTGAELQGIIPPDKDGDTSYMKLKGVQTDPDVNAISLILKNLTEYFPVWPVLGTCSTDRCNSKEFTRDHASGDSLKPAGYLNNGRKTGTVQANDLLQINLCSNRMLALEACFVDDDNDAVVLSNTALRFFDIDHGKNYATGPEVMQFMCTGGTFTLYGFEKDGTEDAEFLVHMSTNAQALERPDTGELTVNGLPIHVYDCPTNEWVTIWSSRIGKGKDNPTSSVIDQNDDYGKQQEQSMVQIDFVEQDCMKVSFANMPLAYHVHLEDTADMEKIDRLYASLELTPTNYPDIGHGACPYDQSGRNWLFAGLKSETRRDCTPPPSPPPPPPPPQAPTCDVSQCANGKYASITDVAASPEPTAPTWTQSGGSPDCGTSPTGTPSANLIYDQGTGVSFAACKASCESSIDRCTEITWAPGNSHCVLFDGCDNPGPNTGWERWVPTPTAYACEDTDNGATGSTALTWTQSSGSPDCGTSPTGIKSANLIYEGTKSFAACKASCESSIDRCTEITWAPGNSHCVLFDGCDNPGPNTGWERWVPTPTAYACGALLTPAVCDASATMYDDDDFTASVMCCACGGGITPSPSPAPSASTCMSCDESCDTCSGPSADECTTCPMACPQPDMCANGEYALGTECLPCDASCVGEGGAGPGESCTGPGADECMRCPYYCDEACDGESSPSFADYTSGDLVCHACHASCDSCMGPGAHECTTCDEPALHTTSCGNADCAIGTFGSEATMGGGVVCSACDECCTSCSGPGPGDCTLCSASAVEDCADTCPVACRERGICPTPAPEGCTGCALAAANAISAEVQACATADAPPSPPTAPSPGAQIFDDPHVRTLSGNQYFMHGVGVFDYATIPGVIKTQVYMCPSADCTADLMETGECLTFIQAVAIKLESVHPQQAHLLVFRNSSMKVDHEDRKAEVNVTLGEQMKIQASGTGRATELPERVDHESLADCHVLEAKGQLVPKMQLAADGCVNTGCERAGCPCPCPCPLGAPEGPSSSITELAAQRIIGGVWQDCTRNEWTLSTPEMVIDVGVIGPFEQGYLNEVVSDRSFNLNVKGIKDMDSLQGIINGDKNGLFIVDAELNPEGSNQVVDPNVGALVPKGPHGNVQEVTAANVAPEDNLFPPDAMASMDAACGVQQSLRAVQMNLHEGEAVTDEQTRGWKNWKSRGWVKP